MKSLLAFITLCYLNTGFAWNAEGHRVVSEIAWHHMTAHAKARFNPAHPALDKDNPSPSFQDASVWFDTVKRKQPDRLMHYIDIPFVPRSELAPAIKPNDINGLMAFNQSRKLLLEGKSSGLEEVIALRILSHVTADLHQPMHAVTRITAKHPKGDAGGNKFRLPKNKISRNLHAYWDKGGGFLLSRTSTESKARVLERLYPCDVNAVDKDASHWVAESYVYATQNAYSANKRNIKNGQYQALVFEIAEKRLAIAGCRLAAVLNEIDAYSVPIIV